MSPRAQDVRRQAAVENAIAGYQLLDSPPLPVLIALAQLATVVCGVSSAEINLLDIARQHTIATFGPLVATGSCARADSISAIGFPQPEVVVIADARADAAYSGNPFVTGERGSTVFFGSATLQTPDGWEIGTLCVFDDRPGELSQGQRDGLQTLAHQVVDLFELRRHTRLLHDKFEELARSQRQLRTFAGQISHDLKTPLTSIIGFAEMAADRQSVLDDPVALRYIERTQASGRRMLGLIDDLLDYARVGGALHRREIRIADVIEQVKGDMRWVAVGAGVTTTAEGSLYADPSQIRLLLQNLVSNALKYGVRAGGELHVSVMPSAGGRTLQVADNGPGIPPEDRAAVLEPLARLRSDVPGTGLGLATCQRIARAHGGALMLRDTPGGGLTVLVEFPDVVSDGGPSAGSMPGGTWGKMEP